MREAVAAEVTRVRAIEDPLKTVQEVGETFAAVDEALADLLLLRLRAISELREEGWSYDRIAAETGLSKPRVAQLAREASKRKL